MDFLVNHEKITGTKVLLDTTCEQSAELDYILPDYYPDIFRILKCRFIPTITSQSLNGNRFSYELCVKIKILYQSAENKKINCIEQQQSFSKTLELSGDAMNPDISLCPRTDYINCRVQNQRRLDIRGCVSVRVKITGEEQTELLTGASGCGIQLKREKVTVPTKRLCAFKRITVSEEIELSEQKPDIESLIRTCADAEITELSTIPGKAAVKGDTKVFVLYNTSDDSCNTLKFSVPFSNIIDIDGLDDSFKTRAEIADCRVELISKNNSAREYTCEISFTVRINAYKYAEAYLVSDAYSTCFECENECSQTNIELCPEEKVERFEISGSLTNDDVSISEVIDAEADCYNIQHRLQNGCLVIFGNVDVSVLARDSEGCPVFMEDTLAFEQQVDADADGAFNICVNAKVCGINYVIKSANCVEVVVSAAATVRIQKALKSNALCNIKIVEGSVKQKDCRCALKLYNAESGETVWDIAKRFSTTPDAIMEENESLTDSNECTGMLLIPITD